MSTYLADGNILVKVFKRFMVFASNGVFIDEVEFNDGDYDESEEKDQDHVEIISSLVDKKALAVATQPDDVVLNPKVKIYDF